VAHTQRGRFTARFEPGEGVGYLVVSLEDMMELKTIELLFQLPNLPPVCHHAGVMEVQLPHDMVDDELRVARNVKPLNPEHGGNA
jgi:hypothetical protein